MPVSPLGNTIMVNQMSADASSIQNANNNRVDFQNMVAQSSANEKDEKVLEVRPAEENQEINPDREHQRQEADEESKQEDKEKTDLQEEIDKEEATHHFKLDIKV